MDKTIKINMRTLLFGLICLVLAFGVFSTISTETQAFDRWRGEDPILEVLVKGANLHLYRQDTYLTKCGPPFVPSIQNTWEWVIGSGETCWNVGGISAMGLLSAYERTHNRNYLKGAIAQGNTLIKKYNTIMTNEGAVWENRPFSQDIEFLIQLSRVNHNHSYERVARDWHDIITDNKTAEENVDRYIEGRKSQSIVSMAGWDLASQIRAALAVGKWQYARDMAKRLLERRADWEGISYGETILSYSSLLWAFAELRFGGREIAAAEREFRDLVLEAQVQEGSQMGSWLDGDYQTTAYAILGLDATTGRQHDIVKALGKAFAFLRDTQTAKGGWSYPPEIGEVNSEVLMALSGLHRREIGLR
jgi:hypothetical protein